MRALLTGATGLLGPYLGAALDDAGLDTVRIGLTATPDAGMVRCDLTDDNATEALFADVAPDLVVHAAAWTNVDLCERDPGLADVINRGTAATLARLAAAAGARIVAISTDSVFDGTRGRYVETDEPHPLNAYARSKLAAEQALAHADDSLAIRTNFFGRSARGRGLAEWLIGELGAGRSIVGFSDVVFSPLHCASVAEYVVALARSDVTGVLHLGACDTVSKLEFARLVAVAHGFDPGLITPGRLVDGVLAAPRPLDTSIVSDRAATVLGHRLPTVADEVATLGRA